MAPQDPIFPKDDSWTWLKEPCASTWSGNISRSFPAPIQAANTQAGRYGYLRRGKGEALRRLFAQKPVLNSVYRCSSKPGSGCCSARRGSWILAPCNS